MKKQQKGKQSSLTLNEHQQSQSNNGKALQPYTCASHVATVRLDKTGKRVYTVSNSMHTGLTYVKGAGKKGRGVFALRPIKYGTIIEVAPVILIDRKDMDRLDKTCLCHYFFFWPKLPWIGAIALGMASLYNHCDNANIGYSARVSSKDIWFVTLKDVEADEELTIDYGYETPEMYSGFSRTTTNRMNDR